MPHSKTKTIVIADPDEVFRREMSDVLVPQGKKTLTVNNGNKATELIKEADGNIDFLVISHQIPPIDSYWVLRWIEEEGYGGKFRIMVVSPTDEPDYVIKELKDNGVSAFVVKDISADQICYLMDQIIFRSSQDHSDRALPRIPVSMAIEFSYGRNSTGTGHITDLSESGFHLHTLTTLKDNDEVRLKLSLPKAKDAIDITGQVKRTRSVGRRNSVIKGVGINFTSVSTEGQEAITNFLAKLASRLGLN